MQAPSRPHVARTEKSDPELLPRVATAAASVGPAASGTAVAAAAAAPVCFAGRGAAPPQVVAALLARGRHRDAGRRCSRSIGCRTCSSYWSPCSRKFLRNWKTVRPPSAPQGEGGRPLGWPAPSRHRVARPGGRLIRPAVQRPSCHTRAPCGPRLPVSLPLPRGDHMGLIDPRWAVTVGHPCQTVAR